MSMVDTPSTRANTAIEVIRCLISDEAFGLEMGWVSKVERADRMVRLAEAGGLVGVLPDPAGEVPVYDLAGRLGRVPAEQPSIQHIVVVDGEPGPVGLLVDRVSPVQRVPEGSFLCLPPLLAGASGRFFKGVIRLPDMLMLWLAPGRIVPGLEPRWDDRGRASTPGPPAERSPRPNKDLEGRRRGGEGQLVLFSTADPAARRRPVSFGLSITQVLEILDPPAIVRVPGAPESILGLVAWHDRAIPVVDLARRIGLPSLAPDARTRLMVVRATSASEPIAFPVRPTVRVRRLPIAHLPCYSPPPIDLTMARGAMELKNETLVIPDLDSVADIGRA